MYYLCEPSKTTPKRYRALFSTTEEQKNDEYQYRLTTHSLAKAKEQGVKIEQLLPLLAKYSAGIPPSLVKALKRWEVNGTEARAETQVILRLGKPEILEELRKSMHEVITAWWSDEPEDLREDLRDALQISRGIPQEVDRQLLLRMRQRLARALSLPEKKMLREMVREKVLGPLANVEPTPPVPAEHID